MKVDVIACFYRQERYEDFFWWGIEQNRDAIGRVFVVNDEDVPNPLSIPVEYLSHPHNGPGTHGVGQSFNEGMQSSDSEYVFLISFDQVLPPNCIARISELARPNGLVAGGVHTIAPDTAIEELHSPRVVKAADTASLANTMNLIYRNWWYCHNGHLLVPRLAALSIGGFDETYVRLGYGYEDLDFAVRFITAFGPENTLHGPTHSWHFGDVGERPVIAPEGDRKTLSQATYAQFTKALVGLYGPSYSLFCNGWEFPHVVNVGNYGCKTNGADTMMDCIHPAWIPDASALTIYTRIPNRDMRLEETREHLRILKDKIQEDGSIIVTLGLLGRGHIKSVAESLGFEIDEQPGHLELFRSDL